MNVVRDIDILLVEDSANDAELTMRALRDQRLGNRIQWVQDGAEALDFLFCRGSYAGRQEQTGPKLVMLDIKLPKVDGIEVARQIKADARTRHLPVVMLTSSAEERDIVESYRLGVNSYVVKPMGFEKFAKAVSELGLYWMILNECP